LISTLGFIRIVMQSHLRRTVSLIALVLPLFVSAQDGLSDAVRELMQKGESGDAAAQFAVANAFDRGRGAPRDGQEAMRWYKAAAEQGYAEAQNSVGSGLQAENRHPEARFWYEKAAAQNHALATNNLAYLYDLGLGIGQDRQRALNLYLKAGDLGWAESMWNIANMYGAGQLGQPPDIVLACVWTLRAAKYARPQERQLIAQVSRVTPMLERRLSSEQMNTCRDQAQSWSPSLSTTRSDLPRNVQ
jgi:TPR repeat protein